MVHGDAGGQGEQAGPFARCGPPSQGEQQIPFVVVLIDKTGFGHGEDLPVRSDGNIGEIFFIPHGFPEDVLPGNVVFFDRVSFYTAGDRVADAHGIQRQIAEIQRNFVEKLRLLGFGEKSILQPVQKGHGDGIVSEITEKFAVRAELDHAVVGAVRYNGDDTGPVRPPLFWA